MQRIVLALVASAVVSAASQARSVAPWPAAPFDDVPPCHWAADAVADVAGLGIFIGFPSDARHDSVNALWQVFEGLRCDDPGWSLRFLQGAPTTFGLAQPVMLTAFALEPVVEELHEDRAVVSFSLTVVIDDAGVVRTESREGTVTLRSEAHGWRVAYGGLADLDLAIFP